MRRCQVFRLPTAHPADTSHLTALVANGTIPAADIRAIFGKTEGNGCVNDFARPYAVAALREALAAPLGCTAAEVGHRVATVMSGGTEGGLSPHILIFVSSQTNAPPAPKLAIGTAFTRTFLPEEIGRMPQSKPLPKP